MKKTLSKCFLFINITLLLTGCLFKTSLEFLPYEDFLSPLDNKKEVQGDGYYKLGSYQPLTYYDLDGNKKIIDEFKDVYNSSNNGRPYLNMQSIGEQNLLVIPVSFLDSNKNDQKDKLIYLNNAFFGDKSKTISESVASFYNTSSYGHLILKGKVSSFFNLNINSGDLLRYCKSKTNASRYVVDEAIKWYKQNYDDIDSFDNDNDGYIDGVFIVYDAPYINSHKNSSLFWAYVDHMKKNESITFKDEKVILNDDKDNFISTYAWASYYFTNPTNNYVDSHVFIHEVGHIFGLQDYYSSAIYQPLGFLDMMDYNIGDHNAFSKMLLNWATPYVVSDSTTIRIKPTITSGDMILLPCGTWNKTPYDEFLLLEFYAPIKTNEYDNKLTFTYQNGSNQTKNGKIFTNYGIKVYHVDSTIAYVKNKGLGNIISLFDDKDVLNKLNQYKLDCEKEGVYPSYCIDFAYTNNNISHPYIKLLESSGNNTLINGNAADNDTLFKKGDTFGIEEFKNFTFYDGTKLEYTFTINDINSLYAEITFEKLN